MPLAIGGSFVPTRPQHGSLWVDVRDYGAKADNGITDNSIPFQAAIDDMALKLQGSLDLKGVIFIPSAPLSYIVNKSIWVDSKNIEIQGEGWGSSVIMASYPKHSVFIFGIQRKWTKFINGSWGTVQIDATNRPDLFGKLDSSAVSGPGTNWGIRTNGNSFAQFQAGPLSAGVSSAAGYIYSDNWSETSKLTLEFCIEGVDGTVFAPNAPLLGFGSPDFEPCPFVLKIWDEPNKVLVMFRTSDFDQGANNSDRRFSFRLPGTSGPYRIAVQFDLDSAVCSAFVNGTQVPISDFNNLTTTSTIPFLPNHGLKFITNDHSPFMIGTTGDTGHFGESTGVDLRLYGLRLSNTIRYQNNLPGQRQVRVDNPTAAIDDAYAYFGKDANTICFLKGTDNPATSGRVITVQHGGAVLDGITSGVFLHAFTAWAVAGNAIRNLSVRASNPYGQAICLGIVLEMTIENVRALGGYHGVGSFRMQASYNIYMRNCFLEGFDSAYFGASQILHANEIAISSMGRVAIRHLGCSARWENVIVAYATPIGECVFKARAFDYGGAYSITNLTVDFEGTTLSRAMIYCEAHGNVPYTTLALKDIAFGSIGSGASLVMLRDLYREHALREGWISIENMSAYTDDYRCVIDVDGSMWHGEIKNIALNGTRTIHRQKWGTKTNIVMRETKFIAPPRSRFWYPGAHALEVRSPADGQYTEWRCTAAGTYGTAGPPEWAGLNPISVMKNGIAVYVLNHCYITASIS
ncbi:MAG: hypothetical protein NVSMB9_01310 [Isosphaeraceae bacterium]